MPKKSDFAWLHYQAAKKISKILADNNYDSYIIGGAVRDLLLGITPKDFDIVTNATPEQISQLSGIEKSKYKDPAQAFGVSRVEVEVDGREVEVEVATYRRDIEAHLGRKLTRVEFTDLEEDIKRRDLTINALAFDLNTNELVDHVNGLEDINNKLIRFIGEPRERIKEDPLRILRAIRIKNQVDFNFLPKTEQAIIDMAREGYVDKIAKDRARDELNLMLKHKNRVQNLKDLRRLEVLKYLIPELSESVGVQQPDDYHAEGDVWSHTLLSMNYLPPRPSTRLVWGVLLHDIGKPPTQTLPKSDEDRIRFNQHAQVGAKIAEKIMKRLKFPKKTIVDVEWLVHYHMTIGQLPDMSPSTRQKYMKHRAFEDLLKLHKIDAHASWQSRNDGIIKAGPKELPEIEEIWEDYKNRSEGNPPNIKDDLGIDGNWLMRQANLDEGPKLGELKEAINDAYLDGNINNKRQAKEFISNFINKG